MKTANIFRKTLALVSAALMTLTLAACSSQAPAATAAPAAESAAPVESAAPAESAAAEETPAEAGKIYKVGIVKYVDDASLDQIEQSIQAELDKKGAELGVTFDYADYTKNGQADSTTLNQIAADLIADGVDVHHPDCNARCPDYAGCDRRKCDSGGFLRGVRSRGRGTCGARWKLPAPTSPAPPTH